MKLYEEGNALIKDLQKSLDEAETKIQVIKDKQ
jgi:exodeoxyribonuclease VII small subunit